MLLFDKLWKLLQVVSSFQLRLFSCIEVCKTSSSGNSCGLVCRSFLVVFYMWDSKRCTCIFCLVVAGSQVTKLHVPECRVGISAGCSQICRHGLVQDGLQCLLKMPLVGYPCNLVLPIYDVEWVYLEISSGTTFQVLIDLQRWCSGIVGIWVVRIFILARSVLHSPM